MKSKYTKMLLLLVVLLSLMLASCGSDNQRQQENQTISVTAVPWDKPGAKQPENYTLEEYNALSGAQKLAFKRYLGIAGYEAWLTKCRTPEEKYPWDKPGAKQPGDYTMEEFEALTAEEQTAFKNYLGVEGYDAWLKRIQELEDMNPWERPGAKQPEDYTMAEFDALTAEQQMAFQKHLGAEKFDAWLNKALGPEENYPWDEPGAKQPEEYTWEEFEALTANQQIAFQNHLGEVGFESWLNDALGLEETYPWDEPGAKQPEEYTWEEFEALTAEEQIGFQNYLGEEGFEAWLDKAQGLEDKYPWDEPGAKQPEDYTMEEFEALSAEEQIAFQNYLGPEAFEAWLNNAQEPEGKYPWEKPGAKQPEDYTWQEFEALSAEEQIAFQNVLGPEAFEAWLNRVMG